MPPVRRHSRAHALLRSCRDEWKVRDGEQTHLLLSGGAYRLPDDAAESELIRTLAQDERDGAPNYVVELRTPVSRLYFDLDMFDSEPIPWENVRPILGILQDAVRELYPACTMIVCGNEPKQQEHRVFDADEAAEERTIRLTKTGYHVMWPDVYVGPRHALLLRESMLDRLEEKIDPAGYFIREHCVYDRWEEVLDRSVWYDNGIRMLFQRKGQGCKTCARERRRRRRQGVRGPVDCDDCEGAGYLDTGRPYRVRAVLRPDGSADESEATKMNGDAEHGLKRTTIRVRDAEAPELEGFRRRINSLVRRPERLAEALDEYDAATRKKRRRVGERPPADRAGSERARDRSGDVGPITDPDTLNALERFIDGYMEHGPDGSQAVSKASLSSGSQGPQIFAVGDKPWCANKGDEHSSSQVWYLVTPRTAVQRCFSYRVYNGTRCREFCGPPVLVPEDVARALFRVSFASDRPENVAAAPPPPRSDDDEGEGEARGGDGRPPSPRYPIPRPAIQTSLMYCEPRQPVYTGTEIRGGHRHFRLWTRDAGAACMGPRDALLARWDEEWQMFKHRTMIEAIVGAGGRFDSALHVEFTLRDAYPRIAFLPGDFDILEEACRMRPPLRYLPLLRNVKHLKDVDLEAFARDVWPSARRERDDVRLHLANTEDRDEILRLVGVRELRTLMTFPTLRMCLCRILPTIRSEQLFDPVHEGWAIGDPDAFVKTLKL